MNRRCVSTLCVSIVAVFAISVGVRAQEPPAQPSLTEAISQIRTGDFYGALLTLSGVVSQSSDKLDEAKVLARAHAYRAVAYEGLDQPERARASTLRALKIDPTIAIDALEYGPQVAALFDRARHPLDDAESAGKKDESAGQLRDALLDYLDAYQALPEPAPRADDERLRREIIAVVQRMDASLAVPEEALAHVKKASDLLNAERMLGATGGGAQQAAIAELQQSVRIAPWWPRPLFPLATALQRVQRFDDALLNLNLYKVADPAAYAADLERTAPKPTPEPAPVVSERKLEAPRPSTVVVPVLINVYWPNSARAFGAGAQKVFCDGVRVADLAKDRILPLMASPGTHTVKFRDHEVTALFEAGQEYYLRVNIEGFPAHVALHVTDPDKAVAEIRERNISPNDVKHTLSTDCKAAAAVPKRSGK